MTAVSLLAVLAAIPLGKQDVPRLLSTKGMPLMPAKKPREQPTGLEDYLGQPVVVDTRSTYLFIGTLTRIDRDFITLDAVDVHDSTETRTTKDHYIMEAAKLGLRTNRRATKVRLAEIIAVSLLRDVETF